MMALLAWSCVAVAQPSVARVRRAVCIAMGLGEWGGWPEKEPGTQPGTFSLPKRIQYRVLHRFQRPE